MVQLSKGGFKVILGCGAYVEGNRKGVEVTFEDGVECVQPLCCSVVVEPIVPPSKGCCRVQVIQDRLWVP